MIVAEGSANIFCTVHFEGSLSLLRFVHKFEGSAASLKRWCRIGFDDLDYFRRSLLFLFFLFWLIICIVAVVVALITIRLAGIRH